MGCNCVNAQVSKSEESLTENDILPSTAINQKIQQRLFTVKEEVHESVESRSVSRID